MPGLTSLVFPTYNPGPAIRDTWAEVSEFVLQSPGSWEILFICDGCTDDTFPLLKSLSRLSPLRVRILHHEPNRGKGYSVRRGLQQARGQWCIFTDVDLSYGLDGVLRVARRLWSGESVVLGSRSLHGSSFVIPAHLRDYAYRRRIQSAIFSGLTKALLGLPVTDSQAGLKGFSSAAVDRILPHLSFEGFAFDCQLVLICQHLGFPIPEEPVQFVYHDDESTTHGFHGLRMARDLLRIRKWSRSFRTEQTPIALPQMRKAA